MATDKEKMLKAIDKVCEAKEDMTRKTKGMTCPKCNIVQGESYEGFKEFYCSCNTEAIDNKFALRGKDD